MANTGLIFNAEGSGEYIKAINTIEKAAAKLDSTYKKVVESSGKITPALDSANAAYTSGTKRINSLVDRLGKLEAGLKGVLSGLPEVAKGIKEGFEAGDLGKNLQQQGTEAAQAFIKGMETELEIKSPSQKMKKMAGDVYAGFIAGSTLGKWVDAGVKAAKGFGQGFNQIYTTVKAVMQKVEQAVKQSVDRVAAQFDRMGKALQEQGRGMMDFGKNLLIGGGALAIGTIAAAAFPVNAAIGFEQVMVNIQSVLGSSNEEMALLNQQILEVGGGSTAGVTQTANAFYDIVGGVQDATQHMAILEASLATAEAGQAQLSETTGGLISVMNAYGAENLSASRASDVFSRTVGMGVGTMSQFVAAMSPIGGLAATVGVSFDELGSAMAFLTAQGATTGAAATRLQAAMVALLNPNADMEAALRRTGYESGQAAIQALGLQGALDAVYTALGDDATALAGALGSTEALQGAVALLDESYTAFAATYAEGLDGATARAREIQLQGMYALVAQITSAFQALTIEVGTALMPIAREIGTVILEVLTGVRAWINQNHELFQSMVRFAVVGAVVVGGILAFVGAVSALAGGLQFLGGGALMLVGRALQGLVFILFNPIGVLQGLGMLAVNALSIAASFGILILPIIALVAAFYDIQKNVGGAGDAFNAMMESLQLLGSTVVGLFTDIGNLVGALMGIPASTDAAFSPFTGIFQGIGAGVRQLANWITQIRQGLQALSGITTPLGGTTEALIKQNDLLADQTGLAEGLVAIGEENLVNQEHTVEAGDTLWDLAQRYGTTVEALMEANALDSSLITIGQELVIPVSLDTATLEAQAGALAGGDAITKTVQEPLAEVSKVLIALRGDIDLVSSGFMAMLGGDVTGGIETLKLGLQGVTETAANLWDSFFMGKKDVQTFDPYMDIAASHGAQIETPQTSSLTRFFDFVQPLIDSLGDAAETALDILPQLADGIGGFFTSLVSGVDTEAAMGAVTNLISFFTLIGGAALGGISAALPSVGDAISNFANSLTQLLSGDALGAWTSFWNGIYSVQDVFANFAVGAADGFLTAIENITEIELPSVEEGLGAWVGAWEMALMALNIVGDNILRSIGKFGLDMQLAVIDFVSGLRESILNATNGQFDIFGNAETASAIATYSLQLQQTQLSVEASDTIAQEVNSQLAAGAPLDVNVPVQVNGVTMTLGDAMNVANADTFGLQNTMQIQSAIDAAVASGDLATIEALLPLAVSLDLDTSGIADAQTVETAILGELQAGDAQGAAALVPLAVDLGLDIGMVYDDALAIGVPLSEAGSLLNVALANAFETGDAATAQALIPVMADIGFNVGMITTSYAGTEGFDAIRAATVEQMAIASGAEDTESVALLVPTALAFGINADEVIVEAETAGLSVGDSIKTGLETSLQIQSPSQYAIDVGINMMQALAQGMNSQLYAVVSVLELIKVTMLSFVPTMQLVSAQMLPMIYGMRAGFQTLADNAKGLWTYLRSIKIMMEELGLTPELAMAAVREGDTNANAQAVVSDYYGGGRAEGGGVRGGVLYEVAEGGVPELLVSGNRTYLMPSQDGQVIPPLSANDVMGGRNMASSTSQSNTNSVNYNGDFNIIVPEGVDDPQALQAYFLAALREYHESQPISDKFRNTI